MLRGPARLAPVADSYVILSANDENEIRRAVLKNMARRVSGPEWNSRSGSISVCGNGPSLKGDYPLQVGPIAALNGAWLTLKARGVRPDYIVVHDPSPRNVAWFDDAPDEPIYLLASQVHPDVFDKLAGKKIQVWHLDDKFEREFGLEPRLQAGFTIGCYALHVLNHIGFTHFDLYGYDSCYSIDGEHHASSQDWNVTAPKPYNVGDRMFIAEPWMAAQVQEFLKQIEVNRYNYKVDAKCDGFLSAALEHNTLNVIYDLDVAPGSFDFMCSMLNVENYRQEHGYSRVKVNLKPGKNRGFRTDEVIDVGHEQKNRMLNHVVRPLIEIFGFEETGHTSDSAMNYGGIEHGDGKWMTFPYSPRPSVDKFRATGLLPTYQASHAATAWAKRLFSDRPYVITLREATYWTQRNSNVAEWVKFAKSLDRRVIFLRDTEKAHEPIDGFVTCPEASIDLHKRLALYRQAEMNFFLTNGPGGLAWYSRDIPYFNFQTKALGYHCYDEIWMKDYIGIEPKSQFPWASDRQRFIYAEDTFENIRAAYDEWRGRKAA